MRKGITPIVATVILLLVVIAIAGSAYTYISGYWGGLTSKNVQVVSAACTNSGVAIYLRNVGNANVSMSADVTATKTVVAGNAPSATSFSYNPGAVLTPGQGGSMTDAFCNTTINGGSTCRYAVGVAGGSSTIQVTC